jgi:hypothetical protein
MKSKKLPKKFIVSSIALTNLRKGGKHVYLYTKERRKHEIMV